MSKTTDNLPTLLPYLQSGPGRFALRLPPARQAAAAAALSDDDQSDPLARIVAAQIMTDAGSEVRPVWLHVQRDACDHLVPSFPDLANPQVEECWQRAAGKGTEWLFLDGQRDADGRLLPFAPLFRCQAKEVWFHPPCPSCGRPLVLCRDDTLLAARGLATYTASLRRFLHCPACADSAEQPFYAVRRENGEDTVHDRNRLILAWGAMAADAAMASGLPCPQCPGHGACFGPGSLALENITALAFYPFYLLISAAADLNGRDFLALLGGAEPQELILAHARAGRQAAVSRIGSLELHGTDQGFLYPADDPRRFYEVLFLKLTFLQELAADLLADSATPADTDLSLLPQAMSVEVPGSGLLPFFWNFRLRRDRVGQYLADTLPLPPPAAIRYRFGLLWLSTLLVNAGQNATVLQEIFSRHLGTGSGARDLAAELPEKYPRVFAPAQLFWNRDRIDLDDLGRSLWQRALACGLDLVATGFAGMPLSADGLAGQIAGLRQEARNLLLPATMGREPAESVAGTAGEGDRSEIHAILGRIRQRWQAAGERPGEAAAAGEPEEETVVLRKAQPGVDPAAGRRADEPPDLEETVILGPGAARAGDGVTRSLAGRDRDAETSVPGAAPVPERPAATGPATMPPPADDGEETVIIAPAAARREPGSGDTLLTRISPAGGEEEGEESLAETIILRPGGRKRP